MWIWGCSPACGNGPSRLLCPSTCITGAPVQSSTPRAQSSTYRATQSEPGYSGAPPAAPPKPGINTWTRSKTTDDKRPTRTRTNTNMATTTTTTSTTTSTSTRTSTSTGTVTGTGTTPTTTNTTTLLPPHR